MDQLRGPACPGGYYRFRTKRIRRYRVPGYPSLNTIINKEEVFGTVEAVKTVSDLFMPVTGKIIGVNPLIDKNPELINQEPYATWLVKVLLTGDDDKIALLTADEYKQLIGH